MSISKQSPPTNRLLAALPASVLASCERVDLQFAAVLCEVDEPIKHAYFPIDGFISLVTALDSGEKLEVGIVGAEGMFGVSLVSGVNVASHHALVQGAGTALRMSVATFVRHFKNNLRFQKDLHSYVYVLMRQLALTAACSHYHNTGARLARWLLLTRDRARSDEFHLTHEFLAYMLGVRRVGITEAATALQKSGLIEYRRGQIVILNGPGLEKASCCCYRQANSLYQQIMSAKSGKSRRASIQ
ncbi:MAG: Crp/Fnr family transcriptional regulator [Steroidobacteraceae bacterium]